MFDDGRISLSLIRNKFKFNKEEIKANNKTTPNQHQTKNKRRNTTFRRRKNQTIRGKRPTNDTTKHGNNDRDEQTTTRPEEPKNTPPKNKEPKSREAFYRPKPQALQARTQNYTKNPQEH